MVVVLSNMEQVCHRPAPQRVCTRRDKSTKNLKHFSFMQLITALGVWPDLPLAEGNIKKEQDSGSSNDMPPRWGSDAARYARKAARAKVAT